MCELGAEHHNLEEDVPDSRDKYLFERLGDHDFQQLVNALLTERFTDYIPLPLRQADGGRDGIARGSTLVYQVKWSSSGKEQSAVRWLAATFKREETKLRRLALEGVQEYVLVTNVASSGKAKTGTFDVLNRELDQFAQLVGLRRMTCLWREALVGMIDSAPDSIKWAYADMLAGWDLIRYLTSSHMPAARDSGLQDLIQKVSSVQWVDDDRVKFSQADVDRQRVSDLFVDITAERLHSPVAQTDPNYARGLVGGAARYLLTSDFPFTLVRGAPGQGKSTLSQYICQANRFAFLQGEATNPFPGLKEPRFPIRLDLGDYAAWMNGVDVFQSSAEPTASKRRKRRNSSDRSLEFFIADLMSYAGGTTVSSQRVQEVLDRVPALVVLDGLDEVAGSTTRRTVVDEIDRFCSRARTYSSPPKIIVTTRPSANELPEPSDTRFEVLSLEPMAKPLQAEYIRRWCAVRGIIGREGRKLRLSYHARIREPHVGELAGNPMQLTILLDLIHQQGEATPTQRTALYDAYMDLLLAREANKHPASVRKHRSDLAEIIPFLGWYIQSRSEEQSLRGRMAVPDLKASMKHFQATYGKRESVVDELFEAATDRLWALTSKEQGTFEFEVLSLREYFAARFLYKFAGEGDRNFDRLTVFRELLRRPYWLNTVRFYGGNAVGSDLYALAAGVRDEVNANCGRHILVAAWTIMTDGVFASRPREAQAVLELMCEKNLLGTLLEALDLNEIESLPELPRVDGNNPTWTKFTELISSDPSASDVRTYVRTVRELLGLEGDFASWWIAQASSAINTELELPWLAVAAEHGAAGGRTTDLGGIQVNYQNAQLILNSGLVPPKDGTMEVDLIRAILDGHCPDSANARSLPSQISAALAPYCFCELASPTVDADSERNKLRSRALLALRRSNSPFARIASMRKFRRGEARSTFPWANTASALFDEVGRCWLASEIAIIGAASSLNLGFRKVSGSDAFGRNAHPTILMSACRYNSRSTDWWRKKLVEEATDDLGKAEWSLAVWAVAHPSVIDELFSVLETVVESLPLTRRLVVVAAANRIGRAGLVRDREVSAIPKTDSGRDLLAARMLEYSGRQYRIVDQNIPDLPSLATVARDGRWLKVDTVAVYR